MKKTNKTLVIITVVVLLSVAIGVVIYLLTKKSNEKYDSVDLNNINVRDPKYVQLPELQNPSLKLSKKSKTNDTIVAIKVVGDGKLTFVGKDCKHGWKGVENGIITMKDSTFYGPDCMFNFHLNGQDRLINIQRNRSLEESGEVNIVGTNNCKVFRSESTRNIFSVGILLGNPFLESLGNRNCTPQ